MCKEFDTIDDNIKYRVSNLILFSIIYSEEVIVEYLDQIFFCFERELTKFSNVAIAQALAAPQSIQNKNKSYANATMIIQPIFKSLKLIGRFCDYDSIGKLIYPTIEGDLNGNYPDMQRGALICLRNIFQGHIESISHGYGIFDTKLNFHNAMSFYCSPFTKHCNALFWAFVENN